MTTSSSPTEATGSTLAPRPARPWLPDRLDPESPDPKGCDPASATESHTSDPLGYGIGGMARIPCAESSDVPDEPEHPLNASLQENPLDVYRSVDNNPAVLAELRSSLAAP